MTAEESKIVYEDGPGHVRILRGIVDDPGPEFGFLYIRRSDKDIYMRKSDILRIETHGSQGARPAEAGEPKAPVQEVLERRERANSVGEIVIAI